MQSLRDFHVHAKKYSKKAIRAWEQECEGVTDDDSPHAHELTEQRNQIEDLLDKGHTLGILGLYAFLERYLNLVIEHLRAGGATIPNSRGRGFNLHQLRGHFHQVGIDIEKELYPMACALPDARSQELHRAHGRLDYRRVCHEAPQGGAKGKGGHVARLSRGKALRAGGDSWMR